MNAFYEDRFASKPFSPAACPVFYGWIIVLLGGIGTLTSMPGQTIGVSAFKNHLRDAMAMTDVGISTAYMVGTILSSLVLVPVGKLLDRLGARVIAPAAATLMGITACLLARCDDLAALLARGVPPLTPGIAAVATMTTLFFLLRFSGQGILTLACRNMVVKWFDHRRGLASGIMGLLTQPGFAATPFFLFHLISATDWRQAWDVLGIAAALGFAPLALLLFRDNPEASGLVPDGRQLDGRDDASRRRAPQPQYRLRTARRTFVFWLFAVPAAIHSMFGTAAAFHVEDLFANGGMTQATAFSSFIPGCIIAMALRPLIGWLADLVRLQHILRLQIVGLMLYMLGTGWLEPGWSFGLYIVGSGLASATFSLLLAITWPTFFGREHLGEISGFVMSMLVFGSAVGPWLFSKLEAITGGYRGVSLACAALMLGFFVASFFGRDPRESGADGG